jgi:hypothetical protein
MSSKNWKSLALVAYLALGLTACGNQEETEAPANPYAGVWANQDALNLYRKHGKDLNQFCPRVLRAMEGKKVDGRKISVYLNPYIVQTNGEVFKYSSTLDVHTAGYREQFYQGVVTSEGKFYMGGLQGDSFLQASARSEGVIKDRSTWTVDTNRVVLTVYKDRKNLYFVRTEQREMDMYLSTRQQCVDLVSEKSADDRDQRSEEAGEQHEDETDLEMGVK